MKRTSVYYETNYKDLLAKYNKANTKELNKILLKYIPKDSVVLDLGFGSGREISFLYNNGYKVYGLDYCEKFIESFSNKNIQVSHTILPHIKIDSFAVKKFDSIISIATLMHLTKEEIKKTIKNIKKILNKQGIVIISYSVAPRKNDERFFEELDLILMKSEFEKCGFSELSCSLLLDGMNRDIEWVTQVFKND